MKTINKVLFAAILTGLFQTVAAAPWVYRGSLSDGGKEANGAYDLRVTLIGANGAQLAQPVTLNGVQVQKGMFQTNVDFGVDVAAFPGAKIKTEVQQGGSGFVQLGDAKSVNAPEGGPGQCWAQGGNTTVGGFTVIGVTDNSSPQMFLNNGDTSVVSGPTNSSINLLRLGGVAQDASLADGDNSAAFNNSNAFGPGSFTIGGGRTGPNAGNSFVYSSTGVPPTAIAGNDGYSNSPGEFVVNATGGIALNASPFSSSSSVTIGGRGVGVTRVALVDDGNADTLFTFAGNPNINNVLTKFGDLGFRTSNGSFFINAQTLSSGVNRLEIFGGSGGTAVVSNGGAFQNASSRAFKEDFQAVNALDVLQKVLTLPMTTWTYKGSDEGTHMGPIAEDFKKIFGLSGDGKGISTVDANGVALAAIQGLNIKLEASEQENAALKARLDALEARLK